MTDATWASFINAAPTNGLDSTARKVSTSSSPSAPSLCDEEEVQSTNVHNIAMVFTGMRHFRRQDANPPHYTKHLRGRPTQTGDKTA